MQPSLVSSPLRTLPCVNRGARQRAVGCLLEAAGSTAGEQLSEERRAREGRAWRGRPRCEHLLDTAKISPANSWTRTFCSRKREVVCMHQY